MEYMAKEVDENVDILLVFAYSIVTLTIDVEKLLLV